MKNAVIFCFALFFSLVTIEMNAQSSNFYKLTILHDVDVLSGNIPMQIYQVVVRDIAKLDKTPILDSLIDFRSDVEVLIPKNDSAKLQKIIVRVYKGGVPYKEFKELEFKSSKSNQTTERPDIRSTLIFVDIIDMSGQFNCENEKKNLKVECQEDKTRFDFPPKCFKSEGNIHKLIFDVDSKWQHDKIIDCKQFDVKSLGKFYIIATKHLEKRKLEITIDLKTNQPHKVMSFILLDTLGNLISDANIYNNFKVEVNSLLMPIDVNSKSSQGYYSFRDISNGKGKYKFVNSSGILFDTANAQIDVGAQSITIKKVKSNIPPLNPSGGPDMQIGIRLTQILKAAAYNDQNTTYALLQQLPHSSNFEIPVPEIGKGCKYYREIKNPLKKGVLILFDNIDRYGNDYGYDVQMIQDITWIIPNESFYFIYESSYAPKRHKERGYRVQKKVYGTYNANSGQTYLENCEIIPSSIKCNQR